MLQPLRQDISISANGIHHVFFGKYLPRVCGKRPHLSLEWYNWSAGYWFEKAIGRLSQRTKKEAHLGLERTARIRRWSFDHNGICPTGMASVQAQECA